ncbi:hypothetical protein CRM90_22505 [Mycobacterium sp. ENV421]|nr:hypothetical protein CRM90_22505 [Mycobacterium sp. ENV421]
MPAVPAEPRKRASRLPDDWMPDQSTIATMRSECPNVDLEGEHRKFTDYWIAKAGSGATKLDWDATWRNWIRKAAESAPGRPAVNPARRSTTDQRVADVQALKHTSQIGGQDAKIAGYLALAERPNPIRTEILQ